MSLTQQTPDIFPMMGNCWASVAYVGPALNQHWAYALSLLCKVGQCASIENTLCLDRYIGVPANTIHCPIVGSMLGQRRRRWTNIDPALGQCLVFAGVATDSTNPRYLPNIYWVNAGPTPQSLG